MFTLKHDRAKICHTSLNQSAMDFQGNKDRIIQSIKFAVENNCVYRVGAELEVPGYSCDDHFKELDLYSHCWETVLEVLKTGYSEKVVIDLGMPILHRSVAYNCKVILFKGKVLLIRPKMHLADEGNYREKRFFMGYSPNENFDLDSVHLPEEIAKYTGQDKVPFGYAHLRFHDATVALEICEEVWRLNSTSRHSYLQCDVIICSNGSHFQKDKLKSRMGLVKEILQKSEGVYIYCNAIGFDGGSIYLDGSNIVCDSTGVIQVGEICSMKEVVCDSVVIDLFEAREDRVGDTSHMEEALKTLRIPEIMVDACFAVCEDNRTPRIPDYKFMSFEEQTMLASTSYLWDYIRKSGASGVFLPLSGGADSGLTAIIVKCMCERLYNYFKDGTECVTRNLRKVVGDPDFSPESPKCIAKRIFFTAYLGSQNSSKETRARAKKLAEFIGNEHSEVEIDPIVEQFVQALKAVYNLTPKYQCEGGSFTEDLALQNIYSRTRMVLTYLMAQMVPSRYNRKGFYLVLSAGNLDENLVGYFTKYDCSSGDLNLLGSMSKIDITNSLNFLYDKYSKDASQDCSVIKEISQASPSAELKPLSEQQTDEKELGLSFQELDLFASARTELNCSVISCYKVMENWLPNMAKQELLSKVKIFFTKYALNKHKCEVTTPSLHITSKNCSSRRYDLRPLVYADKYKYELEYLEKLVNQKQI